MDSLFIDKNGYPRIYCGLSQNATHAKGCPIAKEVLMG
jgi:hypothetical protein